jgi:hypothetical protein
MDSLKFGYCFYCGDPVLNIRRETDGPRFICDPCLWDWLAAKT